MTLCRVLPLLLFFFTLTSMAPKQSKHLEKQMYTVDFGERNWAFKDLRTGA